MRAALRGRREEHCHSCLLDPLLAVRAAPLAYRIAGKIGETKFWRMSKKGCFGEYNFGVSALAAQVLRHFGVPKFGEHRPFANFYSVQYFPLYGTSSGEGAGQRLSRARPYPLQTKGEGLVKSLHTSRAPGRLECDKRNEYWMLACYWAETHAVDLSRAVDAVKKVAV